MTVTMNNIEDKNNCIKADLEQLSSLLNSQEQTITGQENDMITGNVSSSDLKTKNQQPAEKLFFKQRT